MMEEQNLSSNDIKSDDIISGDEATVDDDNLDEIEVFIQANLEDEIVREALDKGVDLRSYSKQVERELSKVESAYIKDYVKESENIASLHMQITTCDGILEVMEGMLKSFQSDLSSISTEIQSLQDESVRMNLKLKNQQMTKVGLSQFVDEMAVNEHLIRVIMERGVTEREFLEQLHELNQKIRFVGGQWEGTMAVGDVAGILEELKFKALEKIREFFLLKIQQFKRPMSNYQVTQNTMLKFRFFNEFLMTHDQSVGREVKNEYVSTISKIYFSYFKSYYNRLMKLQFEEVPSKNDLLAVEETAKKGFFSSKGALKHRCGVFSIGGRGSILSSGLQAPAIVTHSAEKYPYEELFRSMQWALLDNCCREHLFLGDFFSRDNSIILFGLIFDRTLSHYTMQIEHFLSECYDCIGVFLCLRICVSFEAIATKRGSTVLNRYWQTLQGVLSNRLNLLLSMHARSIHLCDVTKLGHLDTRPHYITRRYAELLSAIVGLNEGAFGELLSTTMESLEREMVVLLEKLSLQLHSHKQQLVFLINNYDVIISVILERTSDNDVAETERFKDLLLAATRNFIDVVLKEHFGQMISFVNEFEEAPQEASNHPTNEKRVVQLVRSFNSDWKQSMDLINQENITSFSNFKNGTQILQGSLTQLIQYYHRFNKILTQKPFASYPIRSELINIHTLMVEVKRHKPNF